MAGKNVTESNSSTSYYQTVKLKYSDGLEVQATLDLPTLNRLKTDEGPVMMEEIRKNYLNGLEDSTATSTASTSASSSTSTSTGYSGSGSSQTDYKVWTENETKLLFDLRSSMEDEFNKSKTHSTLWNVISRTLRDQGVEVTASHCKTKWKALKQQFRKTVDHNNQTGADRKTCKFIDEFNQLYGNKSGTKPDALNSSLPAATHSQSEPGADHIESAGSKRKARSPMKTPTMKWLNAYQSDMTKWREEQATRQEKQHQDRMQMLGRFLNVLENLKK